MPLKEIFRQMPGLAVKSSGSGSLIYVAMALVPVADGCAGEPATELVSAAIGEVALLSALVVAWSSSWRRRRLAGPLPMEIGPVTLRMTILEKEMRSKRE